jgi:hypothetical protein
MKTSAASVVPVSFPFAGHVAVSVAETRDSWRNNFTPLTSKSQISRELRRILGCGKACLRWCCDSANHATRPTAIQRAINARHRINNISHAYLDYEHAKARYYERPWARSLGHRRLW